MSNLSNRLAIAALAALSIAVAMPSAAARKKPDAKATEGMTARGELEIVECLLPGQVRMLGGHSYLSPRRPVRTTSSDCTIRGGEYVAYDRSNYQSALKVWMESATAGDAEAQNNVGEIYERGLGGTPNYEAAVIWYQKAADQGLSRAQFNLGTLYEQGLGVPQDKLAAMNLYRKAWGVSEDNIMFASAAAAQQDELRNELNKALSEKDFQMQQLQKQMKSLEQQLKSKPPATTPQAKASDAETQKEIDGLKSWIARLEAERRTSAQQLAGIPSQTREPVRREVVEPLDAKAEARIAKGFEFGRYYALIIGNQDYQVIEDLQTPRTDAKRAAELLSSKYGFTVQLVSDANDVAMLRALNDLNKVLKPNDNVLIYYAGHGTRLKTDKVEAGYWLPVNAERPPNDTFWVPNEQITAHLARLPAKRVLVVADSCYAGLLSSDPGISMFGNEAQFSADYVKYKLPKRARLLLASGGDQPVLDTGGDGDSVFARAFLEVLTNNKGILSTPALFSQVRAKVISGAKRNNFDQTPEFKAIKGAGHEVGDFFFVPKQIG
jgi:uncharacterized coiled-coil protein SlyX